jgi:sugar/nucleoside kinase (ribokinase family)
VRFANGAAALKCMTFGGRKGMPTRAALDALLAGV